VSLINISLDTLVPEKYTFITRQNGFNRVWKAINAIMDAEVFILKLNCVVMKGFNEDEILDFVELTRDWPVQIRFLEFMPFASNGWQKGTLFPKSDMIELIGKQFDLERLSSTGPETAELFQVRGFAGKIGFISSMSDMFCGSCNRLRLTADGSLKTCLFGWKEYPLRDVLRSQSSDVDDYILYDIIRRGVQEKAISHGGMDKLNIEASLNRPMVKIGG